jgi:hypothetical protein
MFAKFRKFVNINNFSFCEATCFQLLNVGAVIAVTGVSEGHQGDRDFGEDGC